MKSNIDLRLEDGEVVQGIDQATPDDLFEIFISTASSKMLRNVLAQEDDSSILLRNALIDIYYKGDSETRKQVMTELRKRGLLHIFNEEIKDLSNDNIPDWFSISLQHMLL